MYFASLTNKEKQVLRSGYAVLGSCQTTYLGSLILPFNSDNLAKGRGPALVKTQEEKLNKIRGT